MVWTDGQGVGCGHGTVDPDGPDGALDARRVDRRRRRLGRGGGAGVPRAARRRLLCGRDARRGPRRAGERAPARRRARRPAPPHRGRVSAAALPELAGVPWRRLVSERSLRRRGRTWTLTTAAHVIPFVATAALLV